MNEVDEVVKQVMAIENVNKYLIYNKDGIVIRYEGWPNDDGDNGYKKCVQLAGAITQLTHFSRNGCEELLAPPYNELECLRLKTKTYEMIIAPSPNFTMVAFQDLISSSKDKIGATN